MSTADREARWKAQPSDYDATAMSRALEIIDALPPELRPSDATPLRDALPGGWPTIGDLRAAVATPPATPAEGRR